MAWYNKDYNNWKEHDKFIMTAAQIEKKIQDIFDLKNKGITWQYEAARNLGVSHNQFMEAADATGHRYRGGFGSNWSGRLNLNDYHSGLIHDIKHNEMMDVVNSGYKLQGYVQARLNWHNYWSGNNGSGNIIIKRPTHKEAMDALNKRIPITRYGDARRAGATHKEVLDAKKQKVNIGNYATCREQKLNHNDAIEIARQKVNPYHYNHAIQRGYTKDEIIDASRKGINVIDYANLRSYTNNHDEAINLHDNLSKLNVTDAQYSIMRDASATHDEAMDAIHHGADSLGYTELRNANLPHDKALEIGDYFNNDSSEVINCGLALSRGANMREIYEAHNYGISMYNYNYERRNNRDHRTAMESLVRDYNPYSAFNWKNSSKEWYN